MPLVDVEVVFRAKGGRKLDLLLDKLSDMIAASKATRDREGSVVSVTFEDVKE